ncbi:MAG: metallophosphoesterase [Clostridia bacterium]|nr:metallophosphoesterase [Clostridia bacterium]
MIAAFWQGLVVREYTKTTDLVNQKVNIALITDLHSTFYGENQEKLIEKINDYSPDLILLAGDIADDEVPHDGTKALLSVIAKKYPCYYVTGNHEFWTNEIDSVKEMISSYGVTILSGESVDVKIGSQTITLGGVDDPVGLYSDSEAYLPKEEAPQRWKDQLQSVCGQNSGEDFSILLSHRPEQTELYSKSGFDLVVSGHAHGGQVRVPFIVNGVYAPNQGLFPEYAGGLYDLGETDLIVSRGLCVDKKPRIFNPPELVFINIEPK